MNKRFLLAKLERTATFVNTGNLFQCTVLLNSPLESAELELKELVKYWSRPATGYKYNVLSTEIIECKDELEWYELNILDMQIHYLSGSKVEKIINL